MPIHEITELKRDPAIELARLFGCLIVIGCHTCLSPQISGRYDFTRTFTAMLFADGVGIFWMIGGAFLFQNKSYGKLLAKSIRKVLIPMLLTGVLYMLYASYSDGNRTLSEIILNNTEAYRKIGTCIIRWKNGVTGYGHSWYVYIYMLLMLIFPALKGIADYAGQRSRRVIVLTGALFLFLIVNDITQNELAGFSHYMFGGLAGASAITLLGWAAYRYRILFQHKWICAAAPIGFIAVNCVRTWIQIRRTLSGTGDNKAIMYWYSSLGVLAAFCVLIFCIALIRDRKATPCSRIICFFASYTFPIYLIHILVRNILDSLGIQGKMKLFMRAENGRWFNEIIYDISIIILIFGISFGIVFLFRAAVEKIKNAALCCRRTERKG